MNLKPKNVINVVDYTSKGDLFELADVYEKQGFKTEIIETFEGCFALFLVEEDDKE